MSPEEAAKLEAGAEVKFRSVLGGSPVDADGVCHACDGVAVLECVVNGEAFTWDGCTMVPVHVTHSGAQAYIDVRNIVEEE